MKVACYKLMCRSTRVVTAAMIIQLFRFVCIDLLVMITNDANATHALKKSASSMS